MRHDGRVWQRECSFQFGEEVMNETPKATGNPREQLLEKLRQFEQAVQSLHISRKECERVEGIASLRQATEELRHHLAAHPAPKEMMEWREMPDTDAEITAFAYELKMEHADLLRELADLMQMMEEYDRALDRQEASAEICSECRALGLRIARHAAGEEAELGRYLT